MISGCSLAREGLRSQRARFDELGRSVADVDRRPDRVTIAFRPQLDRRLLDETLAIERKCCPFYRFEFDERLRQLTVSVADVEHRAALDALVDALVDARGGVRADPLA